MFRGKANSSSGETALSYIAGAGKNAISQRRAKIPKHRELRIIVHLEVWSSLRWTDRYQNCEDTRRKTLKLRQADEDGEGKEPSPQSLASQNEMFQLQI